VTTVFEFEEGKSLALPWKRKERVLPEDGLDDEAWAKWVKLAQHPEYANVLDALGWYVRQTVPDPVNTLGVLWNVSCLPSTGKSKNYRRLAVISCGNLETCVIAEETVEGEPHIEVRINTEVEHGVQPDGDPTWGLITIEYPIATADGWIHPIENLISFAVGETEFRHLETMLDYAYNLNVRVMNHGGTMFRRFNNPYLARDVLSSAVGWARFE